MAASVVWLSLVSEQEELTSLDEELWYVSEAAQFSSATNVQAGCNQDSKEDVRIIRAMP